MEKIDFKRKINLLIPTAMAEANRLEKAHKKPIYTVHGVDGNPCVLHVWNRYFHWAMDRLAKLRGLRV